jgi:hypothetical protein
VRFDKKEAAGMDFLGKIQLIEYAVNRRTPLEFGLPPDGQGQEERLIGVPLWLEKQTSDVFVTLRAEPGNIHARYSVGQLRFVRKVRQSIFSEADNVR